MVVFTYGLNKSECLCVKGKAFSQMGLWIASHGTTIAELIPFCYCYMSVYKICIEIV